MKKALISLFIAASVFSAKAQDIFNNPDNRAFFGVRASYELACPGDVSFPGSTTKMDLLNNSSGFNAGVIYNLPLWKNLYFEPGVAIYYNTWAIDKLTISDGLEQTPTSASVRQWGVRIPINVGYHFDFTPEINVSVFTGPEVNLSFKGNVHMGVDKYNVTSPAFGDDGYFNRSDIKWRIGAGVTFLDHYYVAISGAVGMCDLMRDYTTDIDGIATKVSPKMHSNVFDITFGYNF